MPLETKTLASLPKIELHRHVEGSLTPELILDAVRTFGLSRYPGQDLQSIRRLVTMTEADGRDFWKFLDKFTVLAALYETPEVVAFVYERVVRQAASEGIIYLELQMTPSHCSFHNGYTFDLAFEAAQRGIAAGVQATGITVTPIAVLSRHRPPAYNVPLFAAARDATDERGAPYFKGVSIAGDEMVSALSLRRQLDTLRERGLGITPHAGEVGPAANVREAIETLGATRLGHGFRGADDPEVLALAKARDIGFEICLLSNQFTGAHADPATHPFPKLLADGFRVTLSTDDPGVFGCTLADEYAHAQAHYGLGLAEFEALNHTAIDLAFTDDASKAALHARVAAGFAVAGDA